jgi:hypothetical protein
MPDKLLPGPQRSFSAAARFVGQPPGQTRTSGVPGGREGAASIERDADPDFFAPNNPALPGHLIGLNDQLKFVGSSSGQRYCGRGGSGGKGAKCAPSATPLQSNLTGR